MNSYLITDPKFYSKDVSGFSENLENALTKHEPDFALYRDKKNPKYTDMAEQFLEVCSQFDNTKALLHGDVELAAQCLLSAANLDFSNAEAYYYLGLTSAKKGMLEDAIEFFSHTLDIEPDHLRALRDCAFVYMAMDRPEDAVEKIKEAEKDVIYDEFITRVGEVIIGDVHQINRREIINCF